MEAQVSDESLMIMNFYMFFPLLHHDAVSNPLPSVREPPPPCAGPPYSLSPGVSQRPPPSCSPREFRFPSLRVFLHCVVRGTNAHVRAETICFAALAYYLKSIVRRGTLG